MGDLLHNIFGSAVLSNSAQGSAHTGAIGHAPQIARKSMNRKVFYGNIEVLQVSNGFVVNIGTREGYEYETHIASSIAEVNEIIAAQIVAFKLEDKS